MRVLVRFNPIAGAGKAKAAAQEICRALQADGHAVDSAETTPPTHQAAVVVGSSHELLIVVGGDGTMRQAAPEAISTGVPIYHYPFGTENLFSRDFGMTRDVETLRRAVKRSQVRPIDVGTVNGQLFLLMVSVGFDAEVIHELVRRRRGAIRHWSYVGPILHQIRRWAPPAIRVIVDGETLIDGETGLIVVANSPQYAWRFDPACDADNTDGLLDVVFLPMTSRLQLAGWAPRVRSRRHLRDSRLVYRLGREIEIHTTSPARYQLDGDAALGKPGADAAACPSTTPLQITLQPGALKVLIPGD